MQNLSIKEVLAKCISSYNVVLSQPLDYCPDYIYKSDLHF